MLRSLIPVCSRNAKGETEKRQGEGTGQEKRAISQILHVFPPWKKMLSPSFCCVPITSFYRPAFWNTPTHAPPCWAMILTCCDILPCFHALPGSAAQQSQWWLSWRVEKHAAAPVAPSPSSLAPPSPASRATGWNPQQSNLTHRQSLEFGVHWQAKWKNNMQKMLPNNQGNIVSVPGSLIVSCLICNSIQTSAWKKEPSSDLAFPEACYKGIHQPNFLDM